jgi:hypothetical protein
MPSVDPIHRDYATRAGGRRRSDAERFEDEITRLGREICLVALASELSDEYAPVVTHLLRARTALRAAFAKGLGVPEQDPAGHMLLCPSDASPLTHS